MILGAFTYNDMKSLHAALSTPSVFTFTDSNNVFFCWCLSGSTCVSFVSGIGKPANFNNDFPSAITLEQQIQLT